MLGSFKIVRKDGALSKLIQFLHECNIPIDLQFLQGGGVLEVFHWPFLSQGLLLLGRDADGGILQVADDIYPNYTLRETEQGCLPPQACYGVDVAEHLIYYMTK